MIKVGLANVNNVYAVAIAWQTSAAGAALGKGGGGVTGGERSMGQGVKVAWLSACQRLRRVTVVVRVRLTFWYADRQNGTALLPRSPLPSTPLPFPLLSSVRPSPSSYPSAGQWHSMGATFVWLLDSICNFLRHSSKHSHTVTPPSFLFTLSLSPILPAPCRTSIQSVQQPGAIDSLKLCNFFYFARAN